MVACDVDACFGEGSSSAHAGRSKGAPWRWAMLGILSFDICVSYLPYYAFVPILRQGTQVYNVRESALNVLCILYALAYVPSAFLTGPIVGQLGCRGTFVLATFLNTIGCAVRCGPELFVLSWWGTNFRRTTDETIELASFTWLVFGQALCALGQPLLVNLTSEMGAEWFPPHERPASAMVSNLMNFIGGSLSFMIPPMIVEEDLDSLVGIHKQIQSLLQLQFFFALASFILTYCMFQRAPLRQVNLHRLDMSFRAEVRGFMSLRDFWIVNGQFALYVACCQSFDAVEGSLLEYYGYSAALTSKTGMACGLTSILSTLLEARYITSPSSYKCALVMGNGFMALSLFVGFLCLHFQMHENVFVFAIGIMGLSTPGWGCSCELASEVCFPAREATVTSVLEAFSNLMGVAGIIGTQYFLDVGLGAGVLVVMVLAAIFGGSLLLCLSGRLRRSSAEEEDEQHHAIDGGNGEDGATTAKTATLVALARSAGSSKRGHSVHLGNDVQRGMLAMLGLATLGLMFTSLMIYSVQTQFQKGELLLPTKAGKVPPKQPSSGRKTVQVNISSVFANGLTEPRNVVINCGKDVRELRRFNRSMKRAGLEFSVSPCVLGTYAEVSAAVAEGLVPPSARAATQDMSLPGRTRARLVGKAVAHLRLLQRFISNIEIDDSVLLNVFQDDELVHPKFRIRRNTLLSNLPPVFDFVNLNPLRPAGDDVQLRKGQRGLVRSKVFRMKEQLRPGTNVWMGNYVVSRRGAKKMLELGRSYDTFGAWMSFDKHWLSTLYAAPRMTDFVGFAVQTNRLSLHCERAGEWHEKSVCGGLWTQSKK